MQIAKREYESGNLCIDTYIHLSHLWKVKNNSFGFHNIFDNFFLFTQEVNTALVKLYCARDTGKLVSLVDTQNLLDCDFQDCVNTFQTHQCHHALALFYLQNNKHDEAFNVWNNLLQNSINDQEFPGLECVISQLCK